MNIKRIQSFSAISGPDARILILGSMPGVASLQEAQYYAHPRNAFWPIMGELIGAGLDKSYEERLSLLIAHRIALWDVLQSCVRVGSLDTAIQDECPNDLAAFLSAHPKITHIFLNGGKAEALFKKYFKNAFPAITAIKLPSTSPANAGVSFSTKYQAWANILDPNKMRQTIQLGILQKRRVQISIRKDMRKV